MADDGRDDLGIFADSPSGPDPAGDGATTTGGVATDPDAERRRRKRGGFFSRHKVAVVLLSLLGLVVVSLGGFAFYINRMISGIARIQTDLPENLRPVKAPAYNPDGPPPLNILLAGADNGDNGTGIAAAIRAGTWQPGQHRSDTIMVLHVTSDRKKAYIVSIPRDTYVPINGHPASKINASFSWGGPSLLQLTVEQLTGVRMDHLAIIDWNGFRDLSTALGGVTVFIPKDVFDPMHRVLWTAGTHTLQGNDALEYVRTRYGLENGDFDRIQRQQNFIRETARKLLSKGTLLNPVTLSQSLDAITSNIVVDDKFTDGDIRGLALEMRDIRLTDVKFVTIPTTGFGTDSFGGSTVTVNTDRVRELFTAVQEDDLDGYIARNPDATELREPNSVS